MIVFIIPLISQKISANWSLVQNLLQGTLDSIANQDNQDFKVIVSCHEIPKVELKKAPDRLSFLQMQYCPIEKIKQTSTMHDKGIKCCTALQSLQSDDFQYCMVVDADDRIHRNLVSFLHQEKKTDGWVIDKGFQVNHLLGRSFKTDKLSNVCGSTVIVSREISGIAKQYSLEEFVKYFTSSQGHTNVKSFFAKNNFDLNYLPFYGVQYLKDHGINDSNNFATNRLLKSIKIMAKYYFLGQKISPEEFTDFGYSLANI